MIESGGVGTTFTILDEGSPVITRLMRGFEELEKLIRSTQATLDKFMISPEVLEQLTGIVSAFGEVGDASKVASDGILAAFGKVDDAIGTSTASAKALSDELSVIATKSAELGGVAARAAMGSREAEGAALAQGHKQSNRHGGMHLGGSWELPGGAHVRGGDDGLMELIAGVGLAEVTKSFVEHGMELQHWVAEMRGAGADAQTIADAISASWQNANRNMNASATDGLKNIIELNKVTGSWKESMDLMPVFSVASAAMQSVKAEDLHSKFNEGSQVLNLARGLEELGVTQRGKTPEERQANIMHYVQELTRTMISSRGLFDGNALFAMTNNSGGAAQNWDERMATVIAPIVSDIMKASKMGNADYMAVRSYAGGHITSQAVEALIAHGLTEPGDTYQNKTGWHLAPNSKFAEGMNENMWDWSKGILDKLTAHGTDIGNQHDMNAVVNEIGSNKSTTMLLRALLEPLTRLQIEKEMKIRDAVPKDAAGILQDSDPVLKLDALHKKWNDLLTALGNSQVIDQATRLITNLTSGINALSQAMEKHPDVAQVAANIIAVSSALLVLGGAAALVRGALGGFALGTSAKTLFGGAVEGGAAELAAVAGGTTAAAAAGEGGFLSRMVTGMASSKTAGTLAVLSWLYANRHETGFSGKQQDLMASKGAAIGDIHQWLGQGANDNLKLDTAGPLAAMHDGLAKSMGLFSQLPQLANPSIDAAVKGMGGTFSADVGKLPGMVSGAIGAAIGAIGAQFRGAIAGMGAGGRSTAEEGLSNLMRYQGPGVGRTVSPGVPAVAGRTQAMNGRTEVHATLVLDKKVIGKVIGEAAVKYLAETARYPTAMGGPNGRTHYTSPGTPVTDAA